MAAQNKVVTILGSTTKVESVQFTRKMVDVNGVPTEKIFAQVYGGATRSDGSTDSEMTSYVLTGAAETTVRSYMDGQAVMRLREQMGLESP